MSNPWIVVLIALLVILALALVFDPHWARAAMPVPGSTGINVVHWTCPYHPGLSCTAPDAGGTIWLDPNATRLDLIHELGHQFDYAMSDTVRRRFLAIMRDPRAWRSPPNSPHEQFAEAFRMCWQSRRGLPWRAVRDIGYDYSPTLQQHRKVCRAMLREAERQDWSVRNIARLGLDSELAAL